MIVRGQELVPQEEPRVSSRTTGACAESEPYEAAIPCRPCGGVFVVRDRVRATTVLLRAGFLVSPISPGALIETFSGSTVYLLERR